MAEVSEAISKELFARLVQFPNATEMRVGMHDFYKIALFPGVQCESRAREGMTLKFLEIVKK